MKELHKIIERVILSEKSLGLRETQNVYVFNVNKHVNKNEIKISVEKFFNVKVDSIKTLINRGKFKRIGKYTGKLSNTKKAYVKLKEGQRIKALEV
ncbi:MAG: 50S ribosomal protein L23 [Candidatus Acididesulfobacter diazotrophicus]|uniref:Large ribosomal subunit protein uL23 n=1 Tax=Candidatus Acididesulfobacter diazotrophicus TaxID=2597226 RepID=A0A519BQ60_9DELT|nr:MAG: 50S ribosomal protein L23 [Candidatus Acididesulfobacter diazotrophicus]